VLREDGIFKLWYVGGSDWTEVDGKKVPIYDIRYVESEDGVHWPDTGEVAIALNGPDEHALGRPWVWYQGGERRMMYSSRTRSRKGYVLGFASSEDGHIWTRRDDEVGITTSDEGWDSEAIAYGAVFEQPDRTLLFYNGNDMGMSGFGCAVLVEP
jgi:hypothetical protein